MTLDWYTPPGFGGFTYEQYAEGGLPGSENQALLLCRGLAARGHQVTIYGDYDRPVQEGGVWLYPRRHYRDAAIRDVLVWHRIPGDPPERFARSKAGVKVAWNTDRWGKGSPEAVREEWERWFYGPADLVLNFSQYAVEFTLHHYRVDSERVVHFTHAVEWEHYQGANLEKHRQSPLQLIYCSHPSRGLDNVMTLWLEIGRRDDLLLNVCTDVSLYGDAPQRDAFRRNHAAFFGRRNVYFPGCLGHRLLERVQQQSVLLFYPTLFGETFCVSALECMAAGCIPVTTAVGALPETVGEAGVLVEAKGQENRADFLRRYREALLGLLADEGRRLELAQRGREIAAQHDVDRVAERFERLVGA